MPKNEDKLSPPLQWRIQSGPPSEPHTQIPASEDVLDEVEMIQIHDPGSQRTTIFRAQNGNGQKFVVKEYFRTSRDCRFWEHQLLCQIHASGEVPGVVRLRSHEVVQIPPSNALIRRAVSGHKEPSRSRVRLVLWDYGQPMVGAKSVNDLLCGFYDIIEGVFLWYIHVNACLSPLKQVVSY